MCLRAEMKEPVTKSGNNIITKYYESKIDNPFCTRYSNTRMQDGSTVRNG